MNGKYYFTYLLVVLSLVSTFSVITRLNESPFLKESLFFTVLLIVSFCGLYLLNKIRTSWVLLFGFFTVALANGYYLTAIIGRRSVILNFIMAVTLIGILYSMNQMAKTCPRKDNCLPKSEIVDMKKEEVKKSSKKKASRSSKTKRK